MPAAASRAKGRQSTNKRAVPKRTASAPQTKRARVKKEPKPITASKGSRRNSPRSPSNSNSGSEQAPCNDAVNPLTAKVAYNVYEEHRRALTDETGRGSLSSTDGSSSAASDCDGASHTNSAISSKTLDAMNTSDFHLISILAEERGHLQKQLAAIKVAVPKKKKTNVYKRQPEKVHWDFLLAEMKWMSTDFVNERKAKKKKVRTIFPPASAVAASVLKFC